MPHTRRCLLFLLSLLCFAGAAPGSVVGYGASDSASYIRSKINADHAADGDSSSTAVGSAEAGRRAVEENQLSNPMSMFGISPQAAKSMASAERLYITVLQNGGTPEEAQQSVENLLRCQGCWDPMQASLKTAGRLIFDGSLDFTPIIGDIKGFVEAETKGDYLFSAIGIVPVIGDTAKELHTARKLYEKAKAAGDIKGMQAAMQQANDTARNSPYSSREWRDYLESSYGKENILSSTIPPVNAKNAKLAGKRHPETGIVFDSRGFPIFDDVARYDTIIPIERFRASSYTGQMELATKELYDKLILGQVSSSIFTQRQLDTIKSGAAKIPEFTWHHHQDAGRMQLVPDVIHTKTGLIGGNKMDRGL